MLIKVKVFLGFKKEEVIEKSNDSLEFRIKEKPVGNKANKRIFELLSFHFKKPKKNIRLIKGARQRNKIFEIK